MSRLPLVSIVTPSFNQGEFLEETIQSVLRQDYHNIEYIIIDGGSTDGSIDVIKKYEDRLAYWESEKDRGQTHAIIKGFARATGSILGWLCSDDLLEPSMVSIAMYFLSREPSVGMTFGDRIRIDAKGNIYSLQRFPSFRSYYLKWGLGLPQETVLFRREVYQDVGGLDESLHMAMDFDLWCRMSKATVIRHIPAFLGRFRAHERNKSSAFTKLVNKSGFSMGWPAEFAKVYKKYYGRKPSTRLANRGAYIRQLQAFIERRTQKYQRESHITQSIRQS